MAVAQFCKDKLIQGPCSGSSLCSFGGSTRLVGCSTICKQGTVQSYDEECILQGSNGCYSPAHMVLCCPRTVPSQQGTVQGSPAAAIRLRLVEALLPTTCLLRLVTAFAAGVNSTSLMGSSSESCSTRHSSRMICNARRASSLLCSMCMCSVAACAEASVAAGVCMSSSARPHSGVRDTDRQHPGIQLQQPSKSSEPTCSLMMMCVIKACYHILGLQLTGFAGKSLLVSSQVDIHACCNRWHKHN